MTPKEKAEELIDKYICSPVVYHCKNGCITIDAMDMDAVKRCALIAVDEIMSQYAPINVSHIVTAYKSANDFNENFLNIERQIKDFTAYRILYWTSVKNEIELL